MQWIIDEVPFRACNCMLHLACCALAFKKGTISQMALPVFLPLEIHSRPTLHEGN